MTAFDNVTLVASDPAASVAFYRLLGLDVPDPGEDAIVHVVIEGSAKANVDLDSEHLAGIYNAGYRTAGNGRVVLGFSVETRARVDEVYAAVMAAGHEGRQPPYDAFWGARYAIVADPDGNSVGIMSPPDDTMRSWPPKESPL